MLSVKIDGINLNRKLSNIVNYSEGFFQGINAEKADFNKFLGGYTAEALGKYIDARSRMNPSALHHVYEWGAVGNEKARLFKFNVKATTNNIMLTGSFIQSKKPSPNSDQVFSDKANVMENGIAITISPVRSDVLAFESDGEMVFTRNSITIEHPGGDAVAGSFGEAVDTFFNSYFKNALLRPLIKKIETPKEYSDNFIAGSNSGKMVGVRAGRKYFNISGVVIE